MARENEARSALDNGNGRPASSNPAIGTAHPTPVVARRGLAAELASDYTVYCVAPCAAVLQHLVLHCITLRYVAARCSAHRAELMFGHRLHALFTRRSLDLGARGRRY
jgi:hypothetical protein